jgi:hypothetical protein
MSDSPIEIAIIGMLVVIGNPNSDRHFLIILKAEAYQVSEGLSVS